MSSEPIRFETQNLRWLVALVRQDHHTTATVTGTPKSPAGQRVQFQLTESDQDTLFDRVRAEIGQRDGAILRTGD